MSKLPEFAKIEGKRIADLLGETEGYPRFSLMLLVKRLGTAYVEELAQLALAIHAAGGMQHLDGSAPRTVGGIFFRLAKDKLGLPRYRAIVPHHPSDTYPEQRAAVAQQELTARTG